MKKEVVLLLFLLNSIFCFSQKATDTISLYFSNNSHTPTLKHLAIIDSITSMEQSFFRSIDVIGYTNSLGSKQNNLLLSKKRANNVANEIHFNNLGTINWNGELPSLYFKNRRVDLIINYQELITIEEIVETIEKPEYNTNIIPKDNEVPDKEAVKDTNIKSLDTKLLEVKEGEKIVLTNVTFIGGRDQLLEKSYYDLYKVLRYLKNNPTIQINIQGHICCGSKKNPKDDGLNKRTGKRNLSTARAKRVYKFLKKNGIKKSRMTYEGLANAFPTGKKNLSVDRRVEIEIVSK